VVVVEGEEGELELEEGELELEEGELELEEGELELERVQLELHNLPPGRMGRRRTRIRSLFWLCHCTVFRHDNFFLVIFFSSGTVIRFQSSSVPEIFRGA
jgi:hypothetical protein